MTVTGGECGHDGSVVKRVWTSPARAVWREELAAVQRETMATAAIQRAVVLFDPVWDLLFVLERFRILHLLLESVYGATGELELAFYPLGIISLATEAANDRAARRGGRGMTRNIAPDAPEAETPAQRVTLRIPTHLAAPPHALVLRETASRGWPGSWPWLTTSRSYLRRARSTQAELAELSKLTPARITQIMNLLGLAPDIQEEIFFLPPVTEGPSGAEDGSVERAAGAVGAHSDHAVASTYGQYLE
jgi:hypothetical protein